MRTCVDLEPSGFCNIVVYFGDSCWVGRNLDTTLIWKETLCVTLFGY